MHFLVRYDVWYILMGGNNKFFVWKESKYCVWNNLWDDNYLEIYLEKNSLLKVIIATDGNKKFNRKIFWIAVIHI